MRKTLRLLITICLLTLGHPLYADQIFNTSSGVIKDGTQTPIRRSVTPLEDGFRVAYTIPNYIIEEDEVHPGTYRFHLNEFSSFVEPGTPSLPSKKEFFYVPDSESASVEILSAIYKDYSFNIATNTYEYASGGSDSSDVVTPFDGFHAKGLITEFKGFTYHNKDIISFNLNPILYNYQEKKIRVFGRIIYKINYNIASSGSMLAPSLDNYKIEFNWDEILNTPSSSGDDVKTMLIVAPDSLVPNLKRFIEWKKTLGIDTQVLTENGFTNELQSPTPFTYESIKERIKEFYSSHPKLEYLLFVGTDDIIPGKWFLNAENSYYGSKDHPEETEPTFTCTTDVYYAGLGELLPQFLYGRLPITNSTELDIAIDRIIRYEKDPPEGTIGLGKTGFYDIGVHMAYLDSNGWSGNSKFGEYDRSAFVPASEDISAYITKVTSKKINNLYSFRRPGSNPLYPGITHWSENFYDGGEIPSHLGLQDYNNCKGYKEFVEELNKGRFYAMYLGHGGWDCFYNESFVRHGTSFNAEWVKKLTNIDKLPVIFSMSCNTANFVRKDNLAREFLTYKYGGAVAFFGNTAPSYKGPNEILGLSIMHSIWPSDTLYTQVRTWKYGQPPKFLPKSPQYGHLRLGSIHRNGWFKMFDIGATRSMEAFHCMGDPSMELRTETPVRMGVIYTLTDSTLQVSAPADSRISVYDRKNQIIQSVIGGSYTFMVEKGEKDMSLCVSHSNTIPFIVEKLKITPVKPPFIIVNCESLSPNSIDVTCSVGENESDVSIIATNMLTGETTSNPVTESGESLTRLSVSKSGNYVVGLTQRGQIVDSKKIIVK